MDWGLYRYFLAVAETGSLSGAARSLGVSQPTVGRQIQGLEEKLNARLFERAAHGYVLTATGRAVVELARSIELNAFAIERRVAGEDRSLAGKLCLSAPEGIANCWLMPKLAVFQSRHPEIELELIVGMSQQDLVRREADVALRIGNPGSEELVGRRLCKVSFGLYASESYRLRHGLPRSLDELVRHKIIESVEAVGHLAQARKLREVAGCAEVGFACNSILTQFRALKNGFGLLALPHYMAHGHPDLHRVLPEAFSGSLDLWLLTHRDLKETTRVRALLDFLAAEVARDLTLLTGRQPCSIP